MQKLVLIAILMLITTSCATKGRSISSEEPTRPFHMFKHDKNKL